MAETRLPMSDRPVAVGGVPPERQCNCAEHPDLDVFYDNMAHTAPCECPSLHYIPFYAENSHVCDLYMDERIHGHLRGWAGDPDVWRCQSCRDAHSVLIREAAVAHV